MAASYAVYTANGASGDFAVPFEYFDIEHVEARVDNTIVSFTPLTPNLIRITPTPTSGRYVTLRRVTPPDYVVSPSKFILLLRYLSEENHDIVYNYAPLFMHNSYDVYTNHVSTGGAGGTVGVFKPNLALTPSIVGGCVTLSAAAVAAVQIKVTYDNGVDPEATLATCTVPTGQVSANFTPLVTTLLPATTIYRIKDVSGAYTLGTTLVRFSKG